MFLVFQVYAFEEVEDGCEPKFKWYRRRRLADKMYEFCSDEEDMENIQPEGKNRLPRYKFSTPSPEKNKTNCDKTDLIVNDDKQHHHQIMMSSKLDAIQQPFTKMIINNKIRLTEWHISCNKDKKTDHGLILNSTQDAIDDNSMKNNDAIFSSSEYFDNSSPSSPLSCKNNVCIDSDSNNSINSSTALCSNPGNITTTSFTNRYVSNELKTQLVIKTDDKQDCDIFGENISKHETVLDIIKEWEVDSVSSLSPKCEAWIPNQSDIKRHNVIQKFLEIPQRCDNIRYSSNNRNACNNLSKRRLFDWWSSSNSKERKLSPSFIKSYDAKLLESSNKCDVQSCGSNTDNETECFERLSKFPKIKVVLRPCNRNKHNLNKPQTNADTLLDDDKSISKASTAHVKDDMKPKIFNSEYHFIVFIL